MIASSARADYYPASHEDGGVEILLFTKNLCIAADLREKIFPLLPRARLEHFKDAQGLDDFFHTHSPKALFLDPDCADAENCALPGPKLPPLIYVATHDRAAAGAFRAGAIDYLLSPVDPLHLKESLSRAGLLAGSSGNDHPLRRRDDRLPVAVGKTIRPTLVRDILLFTCLGNQTTAVSRSHQGIVSRSLKTLEAQLDEHVFFRANRSQVFNLLHVDSCENLPDGRIRIEIPSLDPIFISRRCARKFRILSGWK